MAHRVMWIAISLSVVFNIAAQEPQAPAKPPEAAKQQPAKAAAPEDGKPPAKKPTVDRMELDRTQITGSRELPKVLYIVPWKKSDLGDLAGRPTNSLLDEVLAPVDREVFRRQTDYFAKLNAGKTPDAATNNTPPQTEQPAANQTR